MGKEQAAPELEEIKDSFRKKEPSMRPYFLFMGMWLVLFLLLYGALELAGNTSALEIALIGSFLVSLICFWGAVQSLPRDKLRKEAVLFDKLVIFAVFDDFSVIENDNPVALLYCRKSVRDDDSCAF